eukprot:1875289-Rhodomonas_salina.1
MGMQVLTRCSDGTRGGGASGGGGPTTSAQVCLPHLPTALLPYLIPYLPTHLCCPTCLRTSATFSAYASYCPICLRISATLSDHVPQMP